MPAVETLADVFRRYPCVQAVYLFGSQASGATHYESDLDLAVVPSGPTCRKNRLLMLTDLAQDGFDKVDLVGLHGNDLVLQFEAVRPNQVVYQRETFDSETYYSKTVRMYLDFSAYLRVQRAAYKRRLLRGQT